MFSLAFFSESLKKTVQAYEFEVMMSKEYSIRLVKVGFSGDCAAHEPLVN